PVHQLAVGRRNLPANQLARRELQSPRFVEARANGRTGEHGRRKIMWLYVGPYEMRVEMLRHLTMLQVIARGEFATTGFRNRDLRIRLRPRCTEAPTDERRRQSASSSRRLRILRAHGLIRKVPKTHRYMLTKRGQLLSTALFATREASIKQLLDIAA
ncbi:MAG: hypothetical protein MUF54_22345, partial [Polyangiaceae bacterium]|nr:hypothetical protein [Polyangiaceae bacterium]